MWPLLLLPLGARNTTRGHLSPLVVADKLLPPKADAAGLVVLRGKACFLDGARPTSGGGKADLRNALGRPINTEILERAKAKWDAVHGKKCAEADAVEFCGVCEDDEPLLFSTRAFYE